MDPRLVDDASAVRRFRNLLTALHERVRDRHPREALRATVRALLGVAAQTSDQRQVQVELLDEPLHARARLVAHHLPRSQGSAALTIEAETITNVQLFEDEFRSRFASR